MFTGIIEGTGKVNGLREKEEGLEIEIEVDFDLGRVHVGDSIAVNGCCVTVISRLGKVFWAFLSQETLALTTLGEIAVGAAVNLERPLQVGGRLGGHIVQGHIDGVGTVMEIKAVGESKNVTIRVPLGLKKYLIPKGSIAIDGISLTVNRCEGETFSVMIIPHTQVKTTFQALKIGSQVNLEVDIIGKYVEKRTHLDTEEYLEGTKVTKAFLKKHGF